jgi:hypothetical protein
MAQVLFNLTDAFHLCGLIERGASVPKSGATHRRPLHRSVAAEAKARFCRAHGVPHPSVWEWEQPRSIEDVRNALLKAVDA